MSAAEFSRLRRLDTLGEGESEAHVEADAGERAAVAARFGLVAIDRLAADLTLRRAGETILATGRLGAMVTQSCAITQDPVPATIDEPFTLRFRPEAAAGSEEEVELDADDCDTVFYRGGAIDLGEAAAETLALALDPYPRAPGTEAALREAGILSEEEAGPFGALKGLRDRLAGQ